MRIATPVTGINRCWWDLMSDETEVIMLRTSPPSQPHTKYCGEDIENHIRPYNSPVVGTSLSWLVLPGKYTVKLEAEIDGEAVCCLQDIVVQRDPTARPELDNKTLQHELELQYQLSRQIWCALNTVGKYINQMEYILAQLHALQLKTNDLDICNAITALQITLEKMEDSLYQRKITGFGEDLARFPGKMVENLVYLGGNVNTGDFRPTDSQTWQYLALQKKLDPISAELKKALQQVEPLNRRLIAKGLSPVDSKTPAVPTNLCNLFDSQSAF
jgi:hypothetical protein